MIAALVAFAATATVGACSASAAKHHPSGKTVMAKKFVRVAPAGSSPVLLEGGTFGPGGDFYFVNALAKAGTPKVLRLDVKTKKLEGIYTDDASAFTSTQFDPADGRLYVTDYDGGTIDSMKADGSDYRIDFGGPVDGKKMTPDDIAFDPQGDLFVTDATGTPWDRTGRVIRFNPSVKKPTVLMSDLAAPNGISFTPDGSKLWVSEYAGQREDLLTLDPSGSEVAAASIGMRANVGLGGFDSNSVDAAGNVYQCVNELGEILVWNERGVLQKTIKIPQNLGKPELSATNLAIKPGTRDGFIVVGGAAGGFVYKFKALAKGIMPSNGGGVLPHGS
ncbi:MAG TPA: SMP-30/gluconolactonase/LRE family protein [Solirubrobacterales bacterium]|nr:SMP-30/gluconolactonase/LRE family protein [Solirubrobacterales bacterium]